MSMNFKQFKTELQLNFKNMVEDIDNLFEVDVDRDQLWELYLDSFPNGTNPVFRERREYDDSACRQFVRNFGNVVKIKDNKIQTIWDFTTSDENFQVVIDALDEMIKSHSVSDVYITKISKIGTDYNHEVLNGISHRWDHLFIELPSKLVSSKPYSEAEIKGELRSTKDVFKRSLNELTEESVLTVLELISQNSLYKGEEWEPLLKKFLEHKQNYDKLNTKKEKELYAWENSVIVGGALGRIRNHSIGTLLIDISEGKELDLAVKSYERIVAPSNYKRPQAIYTQKMLDEAQKKVEELGLRDSLSRRHANLDDIKVNNILFSNRDSGKRITGTSDVFQEMSKSIPVNPKKFSKVEEIKIEDFIKNVLPTATELELLLENKHVANMTSLVAPINKEAPSMFKWDNAFSWAYSGNITDSSMKENVKMAGGNTEGVLRFSIQWNDKDEYNRNDLDAHAVEPTGYKIYFGNRNRVSPSGGQLDVDIISPIKNKPAVENIIWTSESKLSEGTYKMIVNNYHHSGGRDGFRAEIEFNGQIFSFDYNKDIRSGDSVLVAEVTYSKENGFTIVEKLPSSTSTKEIWGLTSNQFVPVSVVMYSPNYWDKQNGIGNRHFFFMLKDCVNPERPNPFFNEYLKEELNQHRKVFEALGSKMAVQTTEDQLSGVGFSSTKRNEVTVKVKGQTERVLKVLF